MRVDRSATRSAGVGHHCRPVVLGSSLVEWNGLPVMFWVEVVNPRSASPRICQGRLGREPGFTHFLVLVNHVADPCDPVILDLVRDHPRGHSELLR